MTLGLHAKAMSMAEGDRDRLRQLVNGGYLAVAGSEADLTATRQPARGEASSVNSSD